MGANSFGNRIHVSTFGESHGAAVGVLIDGLPAGLKLDPLQIQNNLDRRKPGANEWVSPRKESDHLEILSGFFEGKTLGTPLCALVKNENQKSSDYDKIKNQPRLGHADSAWKSKFHHVDHRGGGRSSGRETLSRVIAGSIAEQGLKAVSPKTKVVGYVHSIGALEANIQLPKLLTRDWVDSQFLRFPFSETKEIKAMIESAKKNGDSFGGVAELKIFNPPPGLGQPVFHKIKADLAAAVLSLGATVGFDFGDGLDTIRQNGIEFHNTQKKSQYGGIQGGLTNGETITFRAYFKPTSSILDVAKKGRHDPCIVPRAIPVLEAMTDFLLFDHWLWSRTDTMEKIK